MQVLKKWRSSKTMQMGMKLLFAEWYMTQMIFLTATSLRPRHFLTAVRSTLNCFRCPVIYLTEIIDGVLSGGNPFLPSGPPALSLVACSTTRNLSHILRMWTWTNWRPVKELTIIHINLLKDRKVIIGSLNILANRHMSFCEDYSLSGGFARSLSHHISLRNNW
jgi:hypothetical protein